MHSCGMKNREERVQLCTVVAGKREELVQLLQSCGRKNREERVQLCTVVAGKREELLSNYCKDVAGRIERNKPNSRKIVDAKIIFQILGIDCYKCYSFNGMEKKCEDTFETDVTTEHLIKRDCFYGYFRGNYCIKLRGTRKDGSTILVRDCSDNDWGRHCGDITFEFTDGKEDIKGCLETCDYDGCNSGNKLITNRHVIWIVSLLIGIILRL